MATTRSYAVTQRSIVLNTHYLALTMISWPASYTTTAPLFSLLAAGSWSASAAGPVPVRGILLCQSRRFVAISDNDFLLVICW
jgi:hypothetical protein